MSLREASLGFYRKVFVRWESEVNLTSQPFFFFLIVHPQSIVSFKYFLLCQGAVKNEESQEGQRTNMVAGEGRMGTRQELLKVRGMV